MSGDLNVRDLKVLAPFYQVTCRIRRMCCFVALASLKQRHPMALTAALRMWLLTEETVGTTNSSRRVRRIGDIRISLDLKNSLMMTKHFKTTFGSSR